MAARAQRRGENVAGDFYVDSTCIDCDQCRAIAPRSFARRGEQSAVVQQPGDAEEVRAALRALVTCPVGSIGASRRHDHGPVLDGFPEPIEAEVHFCGFASEASFGASSYFIRRPGGNWLVDVPRFASQLVRRIEALGGVRTIFLTHIDDVADHAKWAARFGAERILHGADYHGRLGPLERLLHGTDPVTLAADLVAIPTPGHTRGHTVLLYRERFLFSGDHLWWSPRRGCLHAEPGVSWYSWEEQLRSVEKLRAHRFEWVLPGHGRRLHAPGPEMRRQLEACIAAARAAVGR
jgi:glyoxylase-like metal-dependent hydrolase (beta-lactamase superfamily II)/ferredoxin